MACPTTRAKNTSQHPGQVILDTVQKRHTSEQKQADNAQAELVKQEQAAACEQGFKRITEIIDHNEQEQGDILANPPRPRPYLVLKAPRAQLQMDEEEGGEAVEAENADADEDKPEVVRTKVMVNSPRRRREGNGCGRLSHGRPSRLHEARMNLTTIGLIGETRSLRKEICQCQLFFHLHHASSYSRK